MPLQADEKDIAIAKLYTQALVLDSRVNDLLADNAELRGQLDKALADLAALTCTQTPATGVLSNG